MMKTLMYQVEVKSFKEVHELPGGWTNEDFLNLLNELEYDDAQSIAPEELKDMAIMALSDLEPDEAALAVINYRLADQLNKGQKQNLVEELYEDRLWEEYSNINLHKEIFNVSCMLYWAFPKKFQQPDIAHVVLHITNEKHLDRAVLERPEFLCRLLNDGMDEHNIMYRLFDEKLQGNAFPEAQSIIWKADVTDYTENSAVLHIHTALQWVDELKNTRSYDSKAY